MTANEVFRRVVGALEQVGIPYMLTGSFASSYHGAPRATRALGRASQHWYFAAWRAIDLPALTLVGPIAVFR